jgi:ferrous iron transport protein A
MLPLSKLRPGQAGRIAALNGTNGVLRRLLEIGLTEGVWVEVVRLAPLGDPMELRVRNYRLSMRKGEASCIEVADVCPATRCRQRRHRHGWR